MGNNYCKVRNKQQKKKQNNFKIKHNHQLTHRVKATDVKNFANENSHTDFLNKITNVSSTGYKPASNETEEVEPQREILKLQLEQDELIKEGLNIEKYVESIKFKIRKLRTEVLERSE